MGFVKKSGIQHITPNNPILQILLLEYIIQYLILYLLHQLLLFIFSFSKLSHSMQIAYDLINCTIDFFLIIGMFEGTSSSFCFPIMSAGIIMKCLIIAAFVLVNALILHMNKTTSTSWAPRDGHPRFRLYPSHYRADSGLAPVRNVRR